MMKKLLVSLALIFCCVGITVALAGVIPPAGVTTFNGRSGAVTSQAGDYNAPMVGILLANPMDYGAVGDGAHDDTAAIQAAMNNAVDGVLSFPSGKTFLVSAPIVYTNGVDIEGNGSTIKSVIPQSGAGFVFKPASANLSGVHINNLTVDMQDTGDGGILLEAESFAEVKNVIVKNIPGGNVTYNDGVDALTFPRSGFILKGIRGVYGDYYNRLVHCQEIGYNSSPSLWDGAGISFVGSTSQFPNDNRVEQAVAYYLKYGVYVAKGGDNQILQPDVSNNVYGIYDDGTRTVASNVYAETDTYPVYADTASSGAYYSFASLSSTRSLPVMPKSRKPLPIYIAISRGRRK